MLSDLKLSLFKYVYIVFSSTGSIYYLILPLFNEQDVWPNMNKIYYYMHAIFFQKLHQNKSQVVM